MAEGESSAVDMPRLFNVFDIPETKSIRAVSSLRKKIDLEKVWNRINRARKISTSGKEVAKYEVGKGQYLMLFPSGYLQIFAPNEEGVRKVLENFRDELYGAGLLR